MSTTDVAGAIGRLLDEEAVRALTIAYCWALDTKRFEDLRDVFLPDATASLLEERVGIDSIIDRISGALSPLDDSQHMVSNHEVVIDGDRATCRCYLQAQHVRHAAEGSPNYIIAGRYEDDLERTPTGWRIRRRVLTVMWTDGNPLVPRPQG
jgi:hypothetical protein